MLMPIGILTEVAFGVPPVLVLVGGIAIVVAMVWFGLAVLRLELPRQKSDFELTEWSDHNG
jgi:hypothetical protein